MSTSTITTNAAASTSATTTAFIPTIDLTQRPPRSQRVKLGGYVMLPRILDKGRAQLAGKLGEYRYGARSMDRHFFNFTGIAPEALQAQLSLNKGDGEILA